MFQFIKYCPWTLQNIQWIYPEPIFDIREKEYKCIYMYIYLTDIGIINIICLNFNTILKGKQGYVPHFNFSLCYLYPFLIKGPRRKYILLFAWFMIFGNRYIYNRFGTSLWNNQILKLVTASLLSFEVQIDEL